MDFSPITVAIFIFAVITALPGALAAPKKKSAKKSHPAPKVLEVYSAFEENINAPHSPYDVTEIEGMKATPLISKSPSLDARAQARAVEERYVLLEKKVAVTTPVTRAPSDTRAFYSVPLDKTDQLAGRIKLVEAILLESGRAYDYRSTTTAQLVSILNQLRANRPTDEEVRMLLSE